MWLWLSAFLLGQLVETPIYFVALGRPAAPRRRRWQRLAIGFGATALTHPFAWFAIGRLAPALGLWPAVALVEAAVVLVEAAYLRAWRVPRALPWALAANAASFAVGLLL